jgi:hypothetical protein
LGMEPTKKLWKARNISFCDWVLCIIELYPTTTSTTKAKPNILEAFNKADVFISIQ